MARETKEWTGKRDDTMPPPRVRQRIFDRAGGICHWCKLAIKVPAESWQADHVVALINGGENREGNFAPIHRHCHVEKTAGDVKVKAKVAAVRQRHLGIKDAPKLKGAPFPKTSKSARREQRAALKPVLPPRQIYREEQTP